MRAPLAALALIAGTISLAGCASEVGSGIDEARSSAASVGVVLFVRQTQVAVRSAQAWYAVTG